MILKRSKKVKKSRSKIKQKSGKKVSLPLKVINYGLLIIFLSTLGAAGYLANKYYDKYLKLNDLKEQNAKMVAQSEKYDELLKNKVAGNVINKREVIERILRKELNISNDIEDNLIKMIDIKYQIKDDNKKQYINDVLLGYDNEKINTKEKVILLLAAIYSIPGVEKIVDLSNRNIEIVYIVPQDISLTNYKNRSNK